MMKTNQRILIGIGILILIGLLAWAPWITDDYAKNKVIEKEGFPNTIVGLVDERDIGVTWIPFGRFVSTYEHGWFATFYGGVI